MYVMELGATQPHALMRVIEDATDSESFDAAVVRADKPNLYQPIFRLTTRWRMAAAARMLASGTAIGVRLDARTDGYALIYRSRAEPAGGYWYAKLDYVRGSLSDWVGQFTHHPKVLFISIATEDGLDLDRRALVTTQSYPWDDWRVVSAAVRDRSGEWDVRNGSAHQWLTTPFGGPGCSCERHRGTD